MRLAAYKCFKIVRNGLLFLNKYRELIKTAGKRIKKIRFPAAGDCPDIRKEMKHLK